LELLVLGWEFAISSGGWEKMTAMVPADPNSEIGIRASKRISRLTLIFGFAAATAVFALKSHLGGVGVAIGTILAWLNFRWLDQGLIALERLATAQQGSPAARVPAQIYFKIAGRYVLMAAAIYVTVHYFAVPLVSLIAGLLALGAGAMVGSIYEVISGS
jgi:HAMP domain-containing protein